MSKNTDRYSAAELQKKYAGTGYKATSNKGMAASSFWLDDSFLEEKEQSKYLKGVERKSSDYVRLAAYQRAVSNFVRIVTGRGDIPVKYSTGHDSYTDGKYVVLSAKLDEKEFDPAVGLALHEGSHIALTDFEYAQKVFYNGWYPISLQGYIAKAGNVLHTHIYKALTNIIEDRRIDRFVYDSAPGYQAYYQALYNKYFNSKEIDMALKAGLKNDPESWDDYLFHITNFTNPNRNLTVLPALKSIWKIIDIPNIDRLKSTKDVFEVAASVYIAIDEAVKAAATPAAQPEPAKSKSSKSSSKPSKTEKPEEDEDELNENLDTPQTTMSAEPQEANDEDSTEESEESEESDGTGTEGEESDEAGDESSDSGDESEEGEESESGEYAEEESEESDEAEVAAQKEAQEKLLKRIGKDLEKAIKKQQEFMDGKTDKKSLSKTDAKNIEAAIKSNATYEAVGGEVVLDDGRKYDMGKAKVMVVRGLSTELIKSGMLHGHAIDSEYPRRRIERGYMSDYIAEGITLGTLLGKRLKTRDEERSLKTSRLDSGRIDKRLIAELGFGNDRVFAQTQFNTVRPTYIHISLDASGSMSGKPWESAMKTAVAIAKAGSMTASMDVVISVRGSVSDTPLMWVIYDSRKDNLQAVREQLLSVQASGSTPEGLCFEAVQKEMIKDARGKDAFFINVSDGAPAFGGEVSYHGEVAYIHTRNCCNTLRRESINILSYFVSDTERTSYYPFDKMYGKDAAYVDTNSLTQLAKTLNGLFERKN